MNKILNTLFLQQMKQCGFYLDCNAKTVGNYYSFVPQKPLVKDIIISLQEKIYFQLPLNFFIIVLRLDGNSQNISISIMRTLKK
ncbi:hypothetical protein AZF37_00205 [endosymbiont 'TC1' of Trimyema compressum]|nr:hypothetical protein AZF37_00205 [endosymbiont 'TC1' of Trimyema compressum]